jgi:hypothetical protein
MIQDVGTDEAAEVESMLTHMGASLRRLFRTELTSADPLWLRALAMLVATLALGSMALFCVVAFRRAGYPYELEWIEGSAMDQILRIMHGQPLYVEPSIYTIPVVYNPLYYFLAAGFMKFFGVSFLVPRLISILATLGCFALIYLIVSQRVGGWLPGMIAAGMYAASFRFTGAWMDLVKTDSLSLLLLLAAIYVGIRYQQRRAMVLAGLLYVLAYYTKQNILPMALVIAPLSLLESRGRTWPQWLVAGLVGLGIFWMLDVASTGWYSFYTFDLIPYNTKSDDLWYFWRTLVQQMWPALLIGVAYAGLELASVFRPRLRDQGGIAWALLIIAGALILSCWSVFRQRWVYANGFLPACIGLGLLAGLAYGRISNTRFFDRNVARAALLRAGLLMLIGYQFVMLAYDPQAQLPTDKDRAAGGRFIDLLRELPGEVLVFNHGFMSYLAGKTPYFHSAAYSDSAGNGSYPARPDDTDNLWRRNKVKQMFDQAIQQQRFDWVVVNDKGEGWLPYYIFDRQIFDQPDVFFTITGARARPESLLAKNPILRGGTIQPADALFRPMFEAGWSDAEDWGRWALGHSATLQVPLEPARSYQMTIDVLPFCTPQFAGQSVTIGWNERSVGTFALPSCDERSLVVDLPADAIRAPQNQLSFTFDQAISPREAGQGADDRQLALAFKALTFIQQN